MAAPASAAAVTTAAAATDAQQNATAFTLDELLGKSAAESYAVEERVCVVEGLPVVSWRYVSRTVAFNGHTVVGIHGGPAFCHNYILPLILLCDRGFAVVLYDQAGCGRSTLKHPPAAIPEHLLTIDYYWKTELPAVLAAWSIDQVDF
jgi:pimeloyl-ACP methyl ester carboxylesterase